MQHFYRAHAKAWPAGLALGTASAPGPATPIPAQPATANSSSSRTVSAPGLPPAPRPLRGGQNGKPASADTTTATAATLARPGRGSA